MAKIPTLVVNGVKVYDPRIKQHVISDNPALIFAHIVRDSSVVSKYSLMEESTFWGEVGKMADFCESNLFKEGKHD